MTSNASSDTPILGSLDQKTAQASSESKTATPPTSTTSVGSHRSRPLARWFGEVDGELSLRGRFRVHVADAGERTGQVEACRPHSAHWSSTGKPMSPPQRSGCAPVRRGLGITLTANSDQTILVIEVKGMPLDKIAFYAAGSDPRENLAAYLAGHEPEEAEARSEELILLSGSGGQPQLGHVASTHVTFPHARPSGRSLLRRRRRRRIRSSRPDKFERPHPRSAAPCYPLANVQNLEIAEIFFFEQRGRCRREKDLTGFGRVAQLLTPHRRRTQPADSRRAGMNSDADHELALVRPLVRVTASCTATAARAASLAVANAAIAVS